MDIKAFFNDLKNRLIKKQDPAEEDGADEMLDNAEEETPHPRFFL